MRFRRAYYDLFSHVYDRVIALHSGDASARLRDLLIERTGIKARGRLLDLGNAARGPWPFVPRRLSSPAGSWWALISRLG